MFVTELMPASVWWIVLVYGIFMFTDVESLTELAENQISVKITQHKVWAWTAYPLTLMVVTILGTVFR